MEEKTKLENELKKLAVKGVGWIAVNKITTQIVSTLANLVLVRLLFPSDFGTFAIILTLVNYSAILADLGLSKAIIQNKGEPDKSTLRTVWWTQLGLGIFLAIIFWILAPLIISYYKGGLDPKAVSLIRWLSLSQILFNMNSVSATLLEKKLSYNRIFLGEILTLATTQVSTILLASVSFGVASFVIGSLIGRLTALVVYSLLSPWRWGLEWRWTILRQILTSFGIHFQMSVWFGMINGAIVPVFLGRFPGPGGWSGSEAVGFITWVSGVIAMPTIFSGIVNQIIFPLMSRLQNNKDLARRIFTRIIRIIAITALPGIAILVALSPEITKILYTSDWLPALPALRFASIQIVLIMLSAPVMETLLAFGEAKFYRNMHAFWAVFQWVITVPLVLWLGFWGLSLAGIFVSSTALYAYIKLQKYFKFSLTQIIKIPIVASIFSSFTIFSITRISPIQNVLELISFIILGLIIYLLFIYLFMKKEIKHDLLLVKALVSKS